MNKYMFAKKERTNEKKERKKREIKLAFMSKIVCDLKIKIKMNGLHKLHSFIPQT